MWILTKSTIHWRYKYKNILWRKQKLKNKKIDDFESLIEINTDIKKNKNSINKDDGDKTF